ncbi:MAG: hypothetical protein Q7S58_08370 [Candidatus Binatus sp.]|uniref:hypothetical protein n=1 Tax=Candidatus Binatus sp. TaxID=2811406 RepID=UPI0027191E0F|nr:hypothetical protein [Candidatus Binatus sp.]MDO8432406.1 hypothetical protein [Candidatus Binatus sp.]
MMTYWRDEREIKKVLRRLSRQRVRMILQPGNAWFVERAVMSDESAQTALRTCHLRGWAEPIDHRAIPNMEVSDEGDLPTNPISINPVYRLTDSGWNAIHNTHSWIVSTFAVALVTLFATVLGVMMQR